MRRPFAMAAAGALALCTAGSAWWAPGRGSAPARGATYASDGRLLRDVPAPWKPPNLVVLTLDTLRADAVDPVGAASGPPPMPYVASLAARGALFRQASAPAPWTMPSVASLLTGLHPMRHGAIDSRHPPSLPPAVTTYAELLAHAYGYDTAAIVATSWIGGPYAIGQGFARFAHGFQLEHAPKALEAWLAARDASRPFFLYLHAVEPHDPYGRENHAEAGGPRGPVRPLDPDALSEPWEAARVFFLDAVRRRPLQLRDGAAFYDAVAEYTTRGFAAAPRPALAAELRAAYAEGVRWADRGVERTVTWLEENGLLEDTLLVVTSDHGEAFGEHGVLGHGRDLHDELLRVPLVLLGPEPFRGGAVVESSVGLVDVLPTFLDLAGMAPLDGVDGRSFLPVARGDAPGWPVLAQELCHPQNARTAGEVVLGSARSDGWKYVLALDGATGTVREALYDLLLDPGETANLAGRDGEAPPLDPAFCAAVERVRDAAWETVSAGRGGAPGAAGPMGRAVPARPDPCRFP